jgi:hypothetical protein
VAGWGLESDEGTRYSPEDAYPYVYAALLSEELDVEVRATSYYPDQLGNEIRTLDEWTAVLADDGSMQADLADADVVLLLVGFHDVVRALVFGGCPSTWPEIEECMAEVTSPMPAAFDRFYGAVADTVSDDAVVLVADYGIRPEWMGLSADNPDWPNIRRVAFDEWRDSLEATAEAHGFVVVPTSTAIEPPPGEPFSALTSDGLHFNEAGHRQLALVHQTADGITSNQTCPPRCP